MLVIDRDGNVHQLEYGIKMQIPRRSLSHIWQSNCASVTSLLLGLLTTTSPCILPLYPGFLAYLSSQYETGRQKYLLGFVMIGVDHDAGPGA
jgi:thiol:disulfide interchange protein